MSPLYRHPNKGFERNVKERIWGGGPNKRIVTAFGEATERTTYKGQVTHPILEIRYEEASFRLPEEERLCKIGFMARN